MGLLIDLNLFSRTITLSSGYMNGGKEPCARIINTE